MFFSSQLEQGILIFFLPERECVCLLLQDLVQSCLRGGGDIGGHVLRETTSRGLCGLVCPSRTSERGGEGDCVRGGGGGSNDAYPQDANLTFVDEIYFP